MRTVLLILVAILFCRTATAAKTDVVTMANGDRITCEIKKLEHGKLTVKTDDMGTLQIKWTKIARLTSRVTFLVRTRSGALYYGFLAEPDSARVLVVSWLERRAEIPLSDISALDQIKDDFWDKISIEIALGFNYTKATSLTQLFFNTAANYRGRVHGFGISMNGNVTDKGDDSDLYRRYDARASHTRQLTGRVWSDFSVGGQRNDDLGLRLRLLGGAGLGYRILETTRSSFVAGGGVNLTREWSIDENNPANNLEGRFGARFDIFAYDTPKTSVIVEANIYPNLTVSDRLRSQLDVSARREFAKDLFVELKYYESRDTKPPSDSASTSDRGVVFSIGWSK